MTTLMYSMEFNPEDSDRHVSFRYCLRSALPLTREARDAISASIYEAIARFGSEISKSKNLEENVRVAASSLAENLPEGVLPSSTDEIPFLQVNIFTRKSPKEGLWFGASRASNSGNFTIQSREYTTRSDQKAGLGGAISIYPPGVAREPFRGNTGRLL